MKDLLDGKLRLNNEIIQPVSGSCKNSFKIVLLKESNIVKKFLNLKKRERGFENL
jgi:hypothetical protein